jgi:hypothetical protein
MVGSAYPEKAVELGGSEERSIAVQPVEVSVQLAERAGTSAGSTVIVAALAVLTSLA